MQENLHEWVVTMQGLIEEKVINYNLAERTNASVNFLQKVILTVINSNAPVAGHAMFIEKVAALINLLPVKNGDEKLSMGKYAAAMQDFKSFVYKQYKLVGKGYFIRIFLPLGIAIGAPFGLLFKNLALGIPIGLALGVAIGSGLDRKAEKEGRVIE